MSEGMLAHSCSCGSQKLMLNVLLYLSASAHLLLDIGFHTRLGAHQLLRLADRQAPGIFDSIPSPGLIDVPTMPGFCTVIRNLNSVPQLV